MKSVTPFIFSVVLAGAAFAQQASAPPGGGGGERGGPPPERRDGPGPDGPGGGGPRDRGDGPPTMEQRLRERRSSALEGGGGPMGSNDPRIQKLEMLRGYIDAVGGYARLAHDPSTAGIAAVVTAADLLRPRGLDVTIKYFNDLLPETKMPAVQRAIRMHLIDFYKAAGQQDKALEQVRILITAEAGNEPAAAPPAALPPGTPPPPR